MDFLGRDTGTRLQILKNHKVPSLGVHDQLIHFAILERHMWGLQLCHADGNICSMVEGDFLFFCDVTAVCL